MLQLLKEASAASIRAPHRSESAVEAGAAESAERNETKLRLTERDRQLMAMLATVRYLSTEQLWTLPVSGAEPHQLDQAAVGAGRRRKARTGAAVLEAADLPEPRRRAPDRRTLTKLGYAVAESALPWPVPVPATTPGVDFIEHGLMLNELYVQLLAAPLRQQLAKARERARTTERPSRAFLRLKAGLFARAHHPDFRWLAPDTVTLPWREHDLRANKTRDRLIRPEATLELPTLPKGPQRWFLECETGSHSIRAAADEKHGATTAKLAQYNQFITGRNGRILNDDPSTWYSTSYPDGFAPRVVFLLPTEAREDSVRRAIKEWEAETHHSGLDARVYTVEGAAEKLLELFGQTVPPPRPPRTIVSAEVRLIRDFHASAMEIIRVGRAVAAARKLKGAGASDRRRPRG